MTPAVNVIQKPTYWAEVPWSSVNRHTGSTNEGTSSAYCAQDWYYRRRPASITSPWTTIDGIRWRKPLPWSHESAHLRCSGGGFTTSWGSGTTILTQSMPPIWSAYSAMVGLFQGNSLAIMDPELLNVVNRAETSALDNLKLGDVQWGETIFQWRQTASLFTNNISTIARQVMAFKRRYGLRKLPKSRKDAVKKLKRNKRQAKGCRGCAVSDRYLEMVYGWIPLLQDIHGSLELLDDTMSRNGMVVRARGSAKDTTEKTIPIGHQNLGVSPGARAYYDPVTGHTKHRCGVILWYKLRDINVARLAALGLVNPAELAWNLLPWSFVLDWALPIGPWLGSFTADSGFQFITGTRSYKREVIEALPLKFRLESPTYTFEGGARGGNATVHCKAEHFRRTVYSSRPVPGIYYKNPLSVRHVMNAIALLRSAFR